MPPSRAEKLGSLISLFALLVNLLPPFVPSAQASHQQNNQGASGPEENFTAAPASVLPPWLAVDGSSPAGFLPVPPVADFAAQAGLRLAKPTFLKTSPPSAVIELENDRTSIVNHSVLPAWFTPAEAVPATTGSVLPGWFAPPAVPPAAPAARPDGRAIALSQLTVNVYGPAVLGWGGPPGYGEVFTAVIANKSTQVAYNVHFTNTHRAFLMHDGGDTVTSRLFGSIPVTVETSATNITWTPNFTLNMSPGEVITINFNLRADCNATSGQQIRVGVYYNADKTLPSTELNTGGLNVTTGRGNLVIKKEPSLQSLPSSSFGQPITWHVTVQNTGLGKLFGATITDTGGISLTQPTGDIMPSVYIDELDINRTKTYTVVGRVEACNLTNVAQAVWTCGNKAGDAIPSNPLESTASILYNPQMPNVQLEVSTPLTFSYCSLVTRTVQVTVTNTGGPANNLELYSFYSNDAPEFTVLTPTISGDWTYDEFFKTFYYTGGPVSGTLPDGTVSPAVIPLTFDVQPPNACVGGEHTMYLYPTFNDLCSGDPFYAFGAMLDYQLGVGVRPVLDVEKTGPEFVNSGDEFDYRVTVVVTNGQSIVGNVFVTDTVPTAFQIIGPISTSVGITATAGQTLTWNFDPPDGNSVATIEYRVRVRDTGAVGECGAGTRVENRVRATAQPDCPLCGSTGDTDHVYTTIDSGIVGYTGSSGGVFETCGAFVITHTYQITGSTIVTWAGSAFTDTLGNGSMDYVPGSMAVVISGTDYAAALTPTVAAGQLAANLSPLALALPTVPTQYLTINITYSVSIPEDVFTETNEVAFRTWSYLYLPGVSDADTCALNDSIAHSTEFVATRGSLAIRLQPTQLDKCEVNPVRIIVDDETPGRVTDRVVITFTSSSAEIASAHNFVTTGGLPPASSITITTNTDIGGGRGIITFTLPPDWDIAADGEIQFDVDVNCVDEAPWTAGVAYQTNCDVDYAKQTSLAHTYRFPHLILFATPIKYTVLQKEVLWKFFVANSGNLTATNVVITNTLSGLQAISYTADNPAGLTVSTPFTPANPVLFTFDTLAPFEMRSITMTAETIACDPLGVQINATHNCFGSACTNPSAVVTFDTPAPYLLTNNGQTADLPMCDLGEVVFTTKNSSFNVNLYNLVITETLQNLAPVPGKPITVTIIDDAQNEIAVTTAFTPEIQLSGLDTIMIWRPISAPTAVLTWFTELPPLYVVRVQVPVRTYCDPPNTPESFASAAAEAPCGKKLGYTEDAVTIETLKPDMSVTKQGSVDGVHFYDKVYATPGETVTWRIQVDNYDTAQSYVAHNVVLSDTWPANYNFITATSSITHQVNLGNRTMIWDIGDVDKGNTLYFYITGTVGTASDVCAANSVNATRLTFGCDGGCTSDLIPQDTASFGAQPNLTVNMSPGPQQVCGGEIPITIRNSGAAAYGAALTVTLPANYRYHSLAGSSLAPTQIISDNLAQPRFVWDEIPGHNGVSPYVVTLTLKTENSGLSGACPITNSLAVQTDLYYDAHSICTDAGPFTTTRQTSLTVLTPSLILDKTPVYTTASAGKTVTWTLTISNNGLGEARNLIVTDTLAPGFSSFGASDGSRGEPVNIDPANRVITWDLTLPLVSIPAVTEQFTRTETTTTTTDNVSTLQNITITVQTEPPSTTDVTTQTNFATIQNISVITEIFTYTAPLPDLPTPAVTTIEQNAYLSATTAISDGSVLTTTLIETATRVVTVTVVAVDRTILTAGTRIITPFIPSVWTATVTATVGNTGTNLTNRVDVFGDCETGCAHSVVSNTAYVTLLSDFEKLPAVQTGTIGSLAVFHFDSSLGGINAVYDRFTLTDTLPLGLGYLASTLVYTTDVDNPPVTATVVNTPTAITATNVATTVVWRLGNLSGSVEFAGVITAVILDIPANYYGLTRTNILSVSYQEHGRPFTFVFTDTAQVDIVEPVLHLGKSYVASAGCTATLLADNFNDNDTAGWTLAPTAVHSWTVSGGMLGLIDLISPTVVTRAEHYALAGNTAWTDVSYSAMIRPLDTATPTGSAVGLLFRVQSGGNSFYRFRWDADTGARVLERVTNGAPIQLAADTAPLAPGHWSHLEARAEGDRLRVYVNSQLIFDETDSAFATGRVGLYAAGNDLAWFDDVLVTRLGEQSCFVGADELITYTLTISNQNTEPAYDLIITDALPGGLRLATYTLTTNDPSAPQIIITPAAGDSGNLVWGIDHLTPTLPFTSLNHTALTLTVWLTTAHDITANLVYPNRASLRYRSLPGGGPAGESRAYSGGSHSAAVQTVDERSIGLTKTVAFAPPPTATLGSLVTYTLIVPARPLTAALHGVVITDRLQTPRFFIENITTGIGLTPTTGFSQATGLITAAFGLILPNTRAIVTVTARISHEFPTAATDPNRPNVVTNSAVMTHATAAAVTRTNTVSVTVGEPALTLRKSVQSSTGSLTGLDGLAVLTYTLRLTNTGNSPAYSIVVTDALPAGISVTALFGGDARSGPSVNPLTWTVDVLSNTVPANVIVLTYTARLSGAVSGAALTNQANLRYHSLTDTLPGVRPYTATATAVITPALPTLLKTTTPLTGRVGDILTYTLRVTLPAGLASMGGNSYLVDALPPGLHYLTATDILTWTPAAVGVTATGPVTALIAGREVVTWTFGAVITSQPTLPTVVTVTFRAQATGQPDDRWLPDHAITYSVVNTAGLIQRGTPIAQVDAANEIHQPDLTIAKTSDPASGAFVRRGQLITYTLTVTNRGYAPAYDVVITDTLPRWLEFGQAFSQPNPAGVVITLTRSGQHLTWTVQSIAAGPGAAMVISLTAQVTGSITGDFGLTNTAAIPYYDSQPGGGPSTGLTPTQRIYTDGHDSVFHNVGLDWGDLPDDGLTQTGYAPQLYPTRLISDGARHLIINENNPTLGSIVDAEADGQPSVRANGDDLADNDDEDGVTFSGPLIPGETVVVTVTAAAAGGSGLLNAWLDINSDGVLTDTGEQIFADTALAAGGFVTVAVRVPLTVTQGLTTYSRFRFSTQSGLLPTGLAADGEIEDYPLPIMPLDYGDLPDGPYPTTYASDGARHVIRTGGNPTLGAIVDAETNGQPSAGANGDDTGVSAILTHGGAPGDDEDGVSFDTSLVLGRVATITVSTLAAANGGAGGILYGWLDFNGDGDFSDAFEQIVVNRAITAGNSVALTFTVPLTAVTGTVYSRFRFSSDTAGVSSPAGLALDGEVEDYRQPIIAYDLGDLPDSPYPTLYGSSGAWHVISPTLYLGDRVDTEADGQPNAAATGDDSSDGPAVGTGSGDDEDGVQWSQLVLGQDSIFTVTTSSAVTGYLNAWADFNANGAFDAGEQIITGTGLTTGSNLFTVPVPATAPLTRPIYMRFRFSTQSTLLPTGGAPNGEVEDYVTTAKSFDFGDLPNGYSTLLTSDGPRHAISPTFYLGARVDAEGTGQPNSSANGDDISLTSAAGTGPGDDEDGVSWTSLIPELVTTFTITASQGGGYLNGWLDFNANGSFDVGEHVFSGQSLSAGPNSLSVTVPATASLTGTIYMRFRFSTSPTLTSTGAAPDGEVEDYLTALTSYDFGDLPDGYNTLLTSGGARHVINPNVFLGRRVDAETNGQPNATASGDDYNDTNGVGAAGSDDEDGVTFLTPLMPGRPAQIRVTAGGSGGYLNGWFDFDGDGTSVVSQMNDIFLSTGVHTLTVSVPPTATATSLYSRFRFTAGPGEATTPTGLAPNGEVEDYVLLSLGNRVWLDNGAGGGGPNNGQLDGTEAGIGGVTLALRDSGGSPVLDGAGQPITTTTDANGYYLFPGLNPGAYTVYIPAANFAGGQPLAGLFSSAGNGVADDDYDEATDENGLDDFSPAVNGIAGGVITLTLGGEPTGEVGTPTGDANSNLTLDFGFYQVAAGLVKTRLPLTAAIGERVTYVITVPQPALTDDLIAVVVTDDVPSNLINLTAAITPPAASGSVTVTGNMVTATWPIITGATQPRLVITGTIANSLPNQNGVIFTNTAHMRQRYSANVASTPPVTVTIVEPVLNIGKRAAPISGSAGDLLTYTLQISHTPASTAAAFDVVVTDTLPAGLDYGGSQQSSPAASFSRNGEILRWQFDAITRGQIALITYTVRISDLAQPGQSLTNVATATWTSTPDDDNPDERTGSDGPGGSPDDYADTITETITTSGAATLTKRLADIDATRTISGPVPYRIELTLPTGTVGNVTVTDTLEAGLIFNDDAAFSGPAGTPAPTVSTPNDGTAPVTVAWSFGTVTNPASNPQPVVITFTAAVANLPLNRDGDSRDNDAVAAWTDFGGTHVITDPVDTDDVVTIEVPALVVTKTASARMVVPGDVVTWTVTVANVGRGPAYGVDLFDTLPAAYFVYQPGSAAFNGVPIADPTPAGLNLFWDLNQTIPGGGWFTVTFRTLVGLDTPEGGYTNVITAVNGLDEESNPIPPDNTDHVPGDIDPDDRDPAEVLVSLLAVSKTVADAVVIPYQATTYTIRVDNPGGTVLTVTVTDTLPAAFAYADHAQVNGSPQEPNVNIPPVLVWDTLPSLVPNASLTITFRVTASTEVSGTYTNRADVSATDGENVITDTATADTGLTTHPAIVITKTRLSPSPVAQGEPVVFGLTVQNTGDTTLHTVQLVDTYNPAQLRFEQANPAESNVGNGTVTWSDLTATFGDFTPGMTGTVELTFTALHVPGGVNSTNRVQATGIDTNTTTVTDTDSAAVTILSPRLTLDKQVAPTGVISPGAVLTYSLCYTNGGTLTATNVVITDPIPFNTTYVPGSVTTHTGAVEFADGLGWTATEPVTVTALRWLPGDLAPGDAGCVQFNVSVNMTLSDTVSGLAVQLAPQGWAVVQGDASGLEIIGYTAALTVTPIPTITATPTLTATPVLTATPTLTPTPVISLTPTPVVTATPALTSTPVIAPTPALTATPTITATPTLTLTITPTPTPTPTAAPPLITPTATPQPVVTSTVIPSVTATAPPTVEPPVEPSTEPAAPTPTVKATEENTATAAIMAGYRVQAAAWFQPQITPTIAASVTVEPPPLPDIVLRGYPVVGFDTVAINLVNRATIGSNDTLTGTDTVTTPVIRVVDPRLSKSANPAEARPGERVAYTILVENPVAASNANATNVSVVDALPPELTLLDYSVTSSPPLVIQAEVVSAMTRLENHPLGITESLRYTITLRTAELKPGEQITLSVEAEVNAVANPAPRTIMNTAVLYFTEGAARDDAAPVNVPLPPDDGDDDDDDDDAPPPPTATPTSSPTSLPGIQPTPTLPILFLPETGLLGSLRGSAGVDGSPWLGMVVMMMVGAVIGYWLKRKSGRKR